jgi:hypothetical protein
LASGKPDESQANSNEYYSTLVKPKLVCPCLNNAEKEAEKQEAPNYSDNAIDCRAVDA